MLKKYHYAVSVFLVFITLLGTFLMPNLSSSKVRADADQVAITGLSAQEAKITSPDGTDVTNSTNLDSYSSYQVTYHWSIPDGAVLKNGDTFNFELPNNVQVKDTPVTINMTASNNKTWAKAEINPGSSTGTITVVDATALEKYGRSGSLVINVSGKSDSSADQPVPKGWILNKVGWTSMDNQGQKLVHWQIVYNENSEHVKNIHITDTFGAGQSYVDGSMTIRTGSVDENNNFNGTGNLAQYNFSIRDRNITVDIADISQAIALDYYTKPDDKFSGSLENSVTATGTFVTRDNKEIVKGPITVTVPWGGQSSGESYNGKATLTKVSAKDHKALAGAVFEVINTDTQDVIQKDLVTGNDGKLEVTNLPKGNYAFKETKAPAGYQLSTKKYEFTITGDKLVDLGKIENTPISTKPDTPVVPDQDKTINITGHKTWNDNNNQDGIRPDKITIHLVANGKVIQTQEVSERDNWNYSFNNLPEKVNGQKVKYEISEDPVTGYETKINGYNVINSHIPTNSNIVPTPVIPDQPDDPIVTPPLPTDPENPDSQENTSAEPNNAGPKENNNEDIITVKPHSNSSTDLTNDSKIPEEKEINHILPKTSKKLVIYPLLIGITLLLIAGIITVKKHTN